MIRYRFRNSITIRPIVLLAVIRTSSIIIIEPTLWSNRHQNVTVIDLYHILSIYCTVYYTVCIQCVLHTHTPRERDLSVADKLNTKRYPVTHEATAYDNNTYFHNLASLSTFFACLLVT